MLIIIELPQGPRNFEDDFMHMLYQGYRKRVRGNGGTVQEMGSKITKMILNKNPGWKVKASGIPYHQNYWRIMMP